MDYLIFTFLRSSKERGHHTKTKKQEKNTAHVWGTKTQNRWPKIRESSRRQNLVAVSESCLENVPLFCLNYQIVRRGITVFTL